MRPQRSLVRRSHWRRHHTTLFLGSFDFHSNACECWRAETKGVTRNVPELRSGWRSTRHSVSPWFTSPRDFINGYSSMNFNLNVSIKVPRVNEPIDELIEFRYTAVICSWTCCQSCCNRKAVLTNRIGEFRGAVGQKSKKEGKRACCCCKSELTKRLLKVSQLFSSEEP